MRFGKKGFTFIEIVAAIAILAVGILAILTLFPVGIESSKKAAVRTKAALLGEMAVEHLRATKSFEQLVSIPKINFYDSEFDNQNNRIDPENQYQFKVDVDDTIPLKTDGSTGKLKKVVVTVYWPAKETEETKQQQMVFTTYVGDR